MANVNDGQTTTAQDQSICQTYFAKYTKSHTACVKPNKNCQIKEQGLDKKQRQLILDIHNYYRNLIASGNESTLGFPSAANMLTLEWDDELAYVAQKHANQCRFEHDCYDCRRTERYPVVGQNLYIYRTTRSKADPDWRKVIREWYEEIKIAPPQVAFSFDLFQLNIGHFTQIAWAETNRIGCGFSTYLDYENRGSIFKTVQLYTCNYAPGGNYLGEKMYENGTPLSKCPPQYGKSKNFQALCEFITKWESNIDAFALVDNRIDTNLLSATPIDNNPSTSLSIINNNNNNNQYSTVYNRIESTTATSTTTTTTTQRTTVNTPKSRTTSTRRNGSNRRKNTSNRNGNRNRSGSSRTANNRNNSTRRNSSSSNNFNDKQWNSRLNNWKNNSTTSTTTTTTTTSPSTTSPSTSTASWKWNQSSYDWKKWLTNFTTFTNWTKWESKPQRSIVTSANIGTTGQVDPSIRIVTPRRSTTQGSNNNNNNNNGNQNNNVPWRLTNITWWTNWTTTTNAKPKSTNRITTRLPTYTWSLSLGLQRENESIAPNSWSRSIDLTPNRANSALYYRYNNRYNNNYY
ncbi:Peptidase inhibitor 15 [Dermatophagoides farinae]|uniref:Peptidase inhibitor 15 n=1 Tax=Dermatophagoides farinae TaxID=6954 RepID=A0A922I4M8_DERFA|nr:Peptidase inhibitor 15 [Dermatophagoides farinae]